MNLDFTGALKPAKAHVLSCVKMGKLSLTTGNISARSDQEQHNARQSAKKAGGCRRLCTGRTIGMLKERIVEPDCKMASSLDGFLRTPSRRRRRWIRSQRN